LRQLYSDADKVLFLAARPTILNAIEDVVAPRFGGPVLSEAR
jgi:hypothetical protein